MQHKQNENAHEQLVALKSMIFKSLHTLQATVLDQPLPYFGRFASVVLAEGLLTPFAKDHLEITSPNRSLRAVLHSALILL